jgi:hypothetical protein
MRVAKRPVFVQREGSPLDLNNLFQIARRIGLVEAVNRA